MDFDFTQDQGMLRNLVREYLTDKSTVAHVRSMMDDEQGYDQAIYRGLSELGVNGLPEEYGGGGLGVVEQALILEEIGRVAYPSPWFASTILAGQTIANTEDDNAKARYLPDISSGAIIATLALQEASLDWGPEAVNTTAAAVGGGYVLNGEKRFVPWAQAADVIVVVARTGGEDSDGLSLFAVAKETPGVTITPTSMLDLTSRVATVVLDGASVPADALIGEEGGAWDAVQTTLRLAAVGAAAEMLGASRTALDMSTEYAKVRKQFGQFIGQFQAVKHMLAEMLEQVENSHAAVYYAAWAQDADADDKVLAASVAKSMLNEASKRVCGDAIQVHGGIGYTWEYDLHLFWKRAKYYEPMFGDTQYHREIVLEQALAQHA